MGKNSANQQAVKKSIFIVEMQKDLMSFKTLLNQYMGAQIIDMSGIEAAISDISACQGSTWVYEVRNITFKDLYLTRENITEDSSLEMKIKMRGHCATQNSIKDFLDEYCLEFLVKHKVDQSIEFKNAFRFERHIFNIGDENPEFIHPIYHMQYGGDKLVKDEDFEKGCVLFTDAPRIMHPPMDIILAIDFVLGNYYSAHICDAYKRLMADSKYRDLVYGAKQRFWQPYFLGTLSYFSRGKNSVNHFNSEKIDKTFSQNLFAYAKEH